MKQTENFQRIQNAIDQSLIYRMLTDHSLHMTLSQYFTYLIPFYQPKNSSFKFGSLLKGTNPILDNITEEEIISIIQKDNFERQLN